MIEDQPIRLRSPRYHRFGAGEQPSDFGDFTCLLGHLKAVLQLR
jgi:hypothetical protein